MYGILACEKRGLAWPKYPTRRTLGATLGRKLGLRNLPGHLGETGGGGNWGEVGWKLKGKWEGIGEKVRRNLRGSIGGN